MAEQTKDAPKKEWKKPEVRKFSAGCAENAIGADPDGPGTFS